MFWTQSQAEKVTEVDNPTDKNSPSRPAAVKPIIRDIMTQPSTQPILTPQFCFSTGALQDFLRTSRRVIDDTIVENLNALVTPSRDGFDPSSTTQRIPRSSKRLINPSSCNNFKDNVLFPSWKARSEVLAYCESVASTPDAEKAEEVSKEAEFMKPEKPPLYDRRDPYATRSLPEETEKDRLATLVRNERIVETIIRARSWGLVAERCGNIIDGRAELDSEVALEEWKRRTRS